MSYKILLPVTTDTEGLVSQKLLYDLKEEMEHLILLNNWIDPQVAELCKNAASKGAETYYIPGNLGCGPSWNFGIKRMMEDGSDFVIILSPSVVFDKSIQYFIDAIYKQESINKMGRYIASGLATLHCFAHTPLGVELGGYFDENFWPVYYEDTDFCCRSKLNGLGTYGSHVGFVWSCSLNEHFHSLAYSITCRNNTLFKLYESRGGWMAEYYVRKWGGVHNSEIYQHPFNNPNIGINEWIIDPSVPIPKPPFTKITG
jgi:hypothetical protein